MEPNIPENHGNKDQTLKQEKSSIGVRHIFKSGNFEFLSLTAFKTYITLQGLRLLK